MTAHLVRRAYCFCCCPSLRAEGRGLYTEEELDIVVEWARDEKNPKTRLAAAKVLAACIHRSESPLPSPSFIPRHPSPFCVV